jgi:hypothetical protein
MTGTSTAWFVGLRDDVKEHHPRRASLGNMITAATKAGLTVKRAVATGDRIELEFGEPVQAAASEDWDQAIARMKDSKARRVR